MTRNCKIEYKVDHVTLVAIKVGEEKLDIGRKDAEKIVNKFKGDKFIKAKITKNDLMYEDNVLTVGANVPSVIVDCTPQGIVPSPVKFTFRHMPTTDT